MEGASIRRPLAPGSAQLPGTGHAQWYIERFRRMAAEGVDLGGEARLLDAMLARRSRVLDAGCGPGRVGAELAARGQVVVGVDADPELIDAARIEVVVMPILRPDPRPGAVSRS